VLGLGVRQFRITISQKVIQTDLSSNWGNKKRNCYLKVEHTTLLLLQKLQMSALGSDAEAKSQFKSSAYRPLSSTNDDFPTLECRHHLRVSYFSCPVSLHNRNLSWLRAVKANIMLLAAHTVI
jgi:hypothetical protein